MAPLNSVEGLWVPKTQFIRQSGPHKRSCKLSMLMKITSENMGTVADQFHWSSVSFFSCLKHLFPLSHLSFSPLLSFLNLPIYLFPYSCVHCFLISFPSLPAACQWKMVRPRWESWMTEAFLILLLLVHWTQKEKLPLLLLVQFV